MLTMIPGMFGIVITWLILGATCVGLGWGVLRLAGSQIRKAEDYFGAFWVGWAAVIAFLQMWHLFLPVRLAALALLVGSGLVLLIWAFYSGSRLRQADEDIRPTPGLQRMVLVGYLIMMVGFAFWLANHAMGPLYPPYDAGLYHLNCIRWMSEYPAIPGLGNLHVRFASMGSYFLYMAALESVPWLYRSWNAAHGLLLLAVMAQILWSLRKVISPLEFKLHDLAVILFLPIVLKFCFLEAASTAYDLPVFLLGIPLFIQMVQCVEDEGKTDWRRAGVVVLSLGAVATTIKITAVVLATTSMIVLIIWMARSGCICSNRRLAAPSGPPFRVVWLAFLSWLPLPAMLAGGWLITNVICSGYPLSPSTVAGVNVEWKMPQAILDSQMKVNRAWARDWSLPPDQVLANWDWFKPWLKGVIGYFYLEVDIPLAIGVLALLVLGIRQMKKNEGPGFWQGLLLAPSAIGLAFWFFSAPDQRFAGVAFWWMGAGAIVLACMAWGGATRRRCWITVVAFSLLLTGGFDMRLTKLVKPGPLPGGYYPIPESVVKSFVTDSGIQMYVPVTKDQVWDSPLPATPYPDPKLKMRRGDGVRAGFKRVP